MPAAARALTKSFSSGFILVVNNIIVLRRLSSMHLADRKCTVDGCLPLNLFCIGSIFCSANEL